MACHDEVCNPIVYYQTLPKQMQLGELLLVLMCSAVLDAIDLFGCVTTMRFDG